MPQRDAADDMAEKDFDAFVLRSGGALLRMAWMFTGDRHLAEDLVQTALVKTWPHWSRICDGEPLAYVRQVMARTYAAWWRRRWNGEVPTGELPERPMATGDIGFEDREELRLALAELPKGQRVVVVLRYYEDLTEMQTAELLGCSVGAVKSQASKGLAKLRAALTASSGAPVGAETGERS